MGIEIEKLTEKDIRKFKREMEGYEKRKKLFLILGFIFLGLTLLFLLLGVVFIVLAIVGGVNAEDYFGYEFAALFISLAVTTLGFGSTFCVVTIVMFILRGVLFAKKTENRRAAIEEYELYQKELQSHPKEIEVADEVVKEQEEDITDIK